MATATGSSAKAKGKRAKRVMKQLHSWRWHAAFEQRHRFSPTTYGGHTRAAAFASVSRLLAGTRTGRILARHQSPFQTLEQSRFVKRLAQKTDCPSLHRSLSNSVLWKGSNENDRRAVPVSNQVFLQLDAAHTRHLRIRNDAGRFAQSGRGQEFFCRSERVCGKSQRPQQPCRRGAHRSIIVDDRDYRGLCHAT